MSFFVCVCCCCCCSSSFFFSLYVSSSFTVKYLLLLEVCTWYHHHHTKLFLSREHQSRVLQTDCSRSNFKKKANPIFCFLFFFFVFLPECSCSMNYAIMLIIPESHSFFIYYSNKKTQFGHNLAR